MERTLYDLVTLGQGVAVDGFGAHESGVDRLVTAARRAGLDGVAVDVLADRREPEVARARALSLVARAFSRGRSAVPDRHAGTSGLVAVDCGAGTDGCGDAPPPVQAA